MFFYSIDLYKITFWLISKENILIRYGMVFIINIFLLCVKVFVFGKIFILNQNVRFEPNQKQIHLPGYICFFFLFFFFSVGASRQLRKSHFRTDNVSMKQFKICASVSSFCSWTNHFNRLCFCFIPLSFVYMWMCVCECVYVNALFCQSNNCSRLISMLQLFIMCAHWWMNEWSHYLFSSHTICH